MSLADGDLSPGDGALRCRTCEGPMFTVPGWGEYYRCELCGEESPRNAEAHTAPTRKGTVAK